jgi:outer membrane protein TolC
LTLGLRAAVAGQELPALLLEADSANPEIVATRRLAEAASARVPQAGALPDPMLGVGLMNVPVTRPGLDNDMMTMAQLRLAAELPWPGKLGLREEVARWHAEAAAMDAERVQQRVRADVRSAYYEVYFLDRALDVTARNETLLASLASVTAAQYGVGTAAQPDVLKAQVERARLTDELLSLREERVSAVARLNALVGRPPQAAVSATTLPEAVRTAALSVERGGPTFASVTLDLTSAEADLGGDLPSPQELQRLALDHNPMLQAHIRRVAAQEQALALADRAALPDLTVTAGYSYRAGFGDFFDVMVSAPLPILSGRKQDQAIVEQAATLGEHEARHAAMVNELNAELASLVAGLTRGRAQLMLLDDAILPQARAGLESATASYRVGRVDFLTLLDAQVSVFRHELDYYRLLADFATDMASLERAVGMEILR